MRLHVAAEGGALRVLPALALMLFGCAHAQPTPLAAKPAATIAGTGQLQPIAATPLSVPSATLTYLGVAGWKLTSAAGTLLVDPYVTRAAMHDDSAALLPNADAIAQYTPEQASVILVSHSHYDHALDVPAIAQRTSAIVVGTESTANLARASGVTETHIRVAHGGDHFEFGAFEVQVITALHSLTGQENVPIARELKLPLAARDYGEGGTLQYLVHFADHAIFFIGSANFVEDAVRGLRPDIAVVAVGLRSKIPDYSCRLMRALGFPALVIANHFDEFKQPLRPGQNTNTPETQADLDAFAAEIHSCAPSTRVVVPLHMQALQL
jgi:L-ascorbate metabolism protein UlaG (beta-lactamase superfamily)